ncbi:peptide ABC transporter [Paenibacillus odorifer]|uniref:Peptide ABC transporter n=1 Tax=Paenibacillus odorifer TaxID=189426 RepID=A0ABX3GYB9_9BACL|nr:ABC transporter permease [Paenibacillus odorifer]OMC70054.1 peptide ABC transporter [Paenibacillus odorifer]OMC80748.1 peptide ABC transporter [Paenibacillus odorifer]OMD40568.1 peptide ABC transporter [Paenibacillus odorifer]OMD84024.1 peptide ABC transporter [Paenibacillus odorifer]OMD99908.1 peptide ABC transporter [Paenibacillus odorifer]
MKAYLIKRLLSVLPVLFIVSLLVFMIIHLTPGDPASVMLGDEATPEEVAALRDQLGLNLPLYQQYFHWIGNALIGNLGYSYFMQQSVTEAIFDRLGPTLSLAIMAQLIAVVIAIPIGIISARKRGTATDQSLMSLSLLGLSIPNFLLSLFLVLIFTVNLKWLPVAGYRPLSDGLWTHFRYLIIPATALGTITAALIARMTRSSMLEVLNANYIKTARSKGVKERGVIYRHALRNAFLPVLTVIGQTFAGLVAGAAVLETIFNIPGVGQLIVNSVQRRDYSVIQGAVLFITVAFVFINLLVDLLYSVIDPRVRLNG